MFSGLQRTQIYSVYMSALVCSFLGWFFTMMFSVLGFLSPSNRGGLMTVMLFLWAFMGWLRLYPPIQDVQRNWVEKNSPEDCIPVPSHSVCHFLCLECIHLGTEIIRRCAIWNNVCLDVPVVLAFQCHLSFWAVKNPAIEYPVKINKIPRQIQSRLGTWTLSSQLWLEAYSHLKLFSSSSSLFSPQSGWISSITYLDFYSWSSSFSLSLVLKSQYSSATSNFVV